MYKGERFNSISHLIGATLALAGVAVLLAGGVLYASGIVFFPLDRRCPWGHGVWHLFVLGGSISHYVAILRYA